jgi:hypothetical protein
LVKTSFLGYLPFRLSVKKARNMMRSISFLLTAALLLSVTAGSLHAATARPALTVVTPKAGLRVSNEVFTVTGRAAGGAGVTNVLYSLNHGDWTNALTTDNWTNWSATVSLTPGTNVISARAVDGAGMFSPTGTVKFVYVMFSALTVHTNGNVIVSPNLNGAQLQVGRNYSLTGKSPDKGYGARTWTDGDGNVVGNGPNLTFMMRSNLVLTANYGDVTPPRISITSTSTNSDGDSNSLIFYGKATDNVAVAGLSFRLGEFSNWHAVPETSTTNNWTNWAVVVRGLLAGQTNFYIRSVDTSSNNSYTIPVLIYNNPAPSVLAGKSAILQPDDSSPAHTLSFGKSTFSQYSTDTRQVNGVGKYSFSHSAGFGFLKLTYLAPPASARTGTRTIGFSFVTPGLASYLFTNTVATSVEVVDTNSVPSVTNTVITNLVATNTGAAYFVATPALAPEKLINRLIYTVGNDATNARGTLFGKGIFSSASLLGPETNAGKFKYTAFSPVSGLFTLTRDGGTEYIVVTHSATNHGTFYSEDYDAAGHTNAITSGRFMVSLQRPGGNAPASLTNRTFQIYSGGDSFNVTLGDSTYSQDTTSTNFDNVVGGYTYGLDGTNVGQLDLSVAKPPHLAGSNNTARLIFMGGDIGLFTNEDNTFSTFVMSTATNLVPASITNTTLSLRDNDYGYTNILSFADDGTLTIDGSAAGNFTYTPYSPVGAMLRLDLNTTNFTPANDWVQLNFKSAQMGTNYGNAAVNIFDTNSILQDSFGGTFNLH